jgi:hypothetical protein
MRIEDTIEWDGNEPTEKQFTVTLTLRTWSESPETVKKELIESLRRNAPLDSDEAQVIDAK